jgi:predicted alpha/beta hydrolase family esterase
MQADYHIIFIHGYTATPESDWYPAISTELTSRNCSFSIPALPDSDHPDPDAWVSTIAVFVERFSDKKIILVGHSLGTRAIELYLEQSGKPVDCVVLVSAFDNDQQNRRTPYGSFFTSDVDFARVKLKAKKFVIIHSTDDEDIPYSQGEHVAELLGGELITAQGRGHMSDPENCKFILDQILRVIK